MMKKLLFLSAIIFFAISTFSQSRPTVAGTTYTAVATGNWSSANTWDQNAVPSNSTDDVIIPNSFTVTADENHTVSTVTVNTGGTLDINSGITLTTTNSVSIDGEIDISGTFYVGSQVEDHLVVNGGTIKLNDGSILSIKGYYEQDYVDATHVGEIDGTGISDGNHAYIEVGTGGPLNDNVHNVFKISDNCKINTSSVGRIWLYVKEGNTGTAPEIYIGNVSQFYLGTLGIFSIGNQESTIDSDWNLTCDNSSHLLNTQVMVQLKTSNGILHFTSNLQRNTNTIAFNILNIYSGTFQIEPTAGLNISSGQLTVQQNGKLILASDAAGTGELIYTSSLNPHATVNQYITGNNWHLITQTADTVTAGDLSQNHNPDIWLMEYSPTSTNHWNYLTETDDTLNVGQGYFIYGSNDFTATYTGYLRSSSLQDIPVGSTDGDLKCIGNPFSSSLDMHDILQNASNIYDDIWIWSPSNDNYITYTTGGGGSFNGKVAIGQGFFVEASGGGAGSITLDKSNRVFGSPDNFYKSSKVQDWSDNHGIGTYAMLKVSDGKRTDAAFVNFGKNGTSGFENGYDGLKMFGGESAPQLYMVEGNRQLSIDYIQSLTGKEDRVVQMNLKPGVTGKHTIAINLDSLPNTQVTLEDHETLTMHNFNDDPIYTFNAKKGDNPARFLLHFSHNSITGITPPGDATKDNIRVYAWNKAIYIGNQDDNGFAQATIHVYDLMGRELIHTKANLGNLTRIPVQVNNTYLVVRVMKDNNVITKKVFVK